MKQSQRRKAVTMLSRRSVRLFAELIECSVEMIPYKSLQMLACRFNEGDEERIKHHIKYRHKIAKIQFESMQEKLSHIVNVIKDKNPSLVKHICKEVQKRRPWGKELDEEDIKSCKSGPSSVRSKRSGKSKTSTRSKGATATNKSVAS